MMKDEEYVPHGSSEDDEKIREASMLRSRSGRPVKVTKVEAGSETEDDEDAHRSIRSRKRSPLPSKASASSARHNAPKRQRWIPHNPLILGKTEEESSKDIQISDDEESGGEGTSTSRRRSAGPAPKGASVPVRDESGRFAGTRPQTEQERKQAGAAGGRSAAGGGGIFKNAAVQVLREERKLMSTGDIARLALKRGYIKVQGRTPEATMASAMYTDVKRKSARSLFIRPHEGLFGLREWTDEGIEYYDPIQAQPNRVAGSHSRLSNPTSSHPTSRTSRRLTPKSHSRSADDQHHQEEYTSQVTSGRRDMPLGAQPRSGTAGAAAASIDNDPHNKLYGNHHQIEQDHTPFRDHKEGPPMDLFKPPSDGPLRLRTGLSNVRKRSTSGPIVTFPTTQRAPSIGRRTKRGSQAMEPQDSGNMLVLLNAAVEFERSSGLMAKVSQFQDMRLPSVPLQLRDDPRSGQPGIRPLLVQALQPQGRGGPEEAAALSRLNQTDAGAGPSSAFHPLGHHPPEEALRQVEASFGTNPLLISTSLPGPLPSAIPALNLGGSKEGDGSHLSSTTAALNTSSPALAPTPLRLPGSAFQVTGPQMPRTTNVPNFGPPEENMNRIPEIEAHVRELETTLGRRHPKVGKGYLYLSRLYQLKATPEFYSKAQQALTHAYEICYAGQVTPKPNTFPS